MFNLLLQIALQESEKKGNWIFKNPLITLQEREKKGNFGFFLILKLKLKVRQVGDGKAGNISGEYSNLYLFASADVFSWVIYF